MILCALSFDTISNTFLYITSGNTSDPNIWNSEEQLVFFLKFGFECRKMFKDSRPSLTRSAILD